jgi:hypothetical protein
LIDRGLRLRDRGARLRVVDLDEQAARLDVLALDGPDGDDEPGHLRGHLDARLDPDTAARDDVLLEILPDWARRPNHRSPRAERPDDDRDDDEQEGEPDPWTP